MRVLQLIQKKQLRGAEVFASQLSNHLQQQGHEVKLLALVPGDAVLPFNGAVDVLGADLRKKYYDFKGWKKLDRIIRDFNPDVVQANAGDTLKYAIFSRMRYRWDVPVIFRNASVISRYLKGFVSRSITGFLVKRADHIASVSNNSRTDIVKLFRLPESGASVLPIGIEQHETSAIPEMINHNLHIVHVGGFTFEKNHQGLLRIFEKVVQKLPQVRLWLVGDGPLRHTIAAQVAGLSIKDKVIFTGHVNNPLDYIASAGVLVLPSIIEGLPGVIAEAFFCRTPVIASKVGGVEDLVQDGQTGWLHQPEDEEGFANTIVTVLQSGKEANAHILENAFDKVNMHFRNEIIAKEFAKLYQQVSNERR